MLADDHIEIRVGRERVALHPTLRAAMRLERMHGGFAQIIDQVMAGNVTVIASVIREGQSHHTEIADLIESLDGPLAEMLHGLELPLVRFVLQLSDTGESDAPNEGSPKAEPMAFTDYFARLYRIGTGWLGWSPEETWDATASEIIEAYKGRIELLKSIFGTGEANDEPNEQSPEVFNSKLSAVLAMASSRFKAEAA